MFVEVTSMMASVDSSIFGSGTDSTRTSRLPCQVTACIYRRYPSERCRNATVSDGPTRPSRLRQRPHEECQVGRTLGQSPHEVAVPLRAERHVHPDLVAFR